VKTARLEAFSDGVMAVIITVMVLELRRPVPGDHTLQALLDTTGNSLLIYLISFIYVGIYWTNHHHMFHLVDRVSGGILWANLGLLFMLSLFPFTTAWVDENRFDNLPVVIYGVNLILAGIAYYILQGLIIRQQGEDSPLRRAVGADLKGKGSPVLYFAGILCAGLLHGSVGALLGFGFFVAVSIIWVVPDRRIERVVRDHEKADGA
jgi:uncharacterized membrane protein